MSARAIVAVCAACALGTWLLGWWAVPIVAVLAGALTRRVWSTALGALLSWTLLLAWNARGGELGAVAGTLGALLRVPGAALLLVTVLFAGLLGWSGGVIGAEMRALQRKADPSLRSR